MYTVKTSSHKNTHEKNRIGSWFKVDTYATLAEAAAKAASLDARGYPVKVVEGRGRPNAPAVEWR